jgi:hypothetical protein
VSEGAQSVVPPALGDAHPLLRLIKKRGWYDEDGNLTEDAFFLVKDAEEESGWEKGLSVFVCEPAKAATKLKKCHGIFSLLAGMVRGIGLDLEPDSPGHPQYDPEHVLIVGIPNPDEDPIAQERYAGLLRRIATKVPWP